MTPALQPEHHNPGFWEYNEHCDCAVCRDTREVHDEKVRQSVRSDKVLEDRLRILRTIENIIVIYGTSGCGVYIDKYVTKELRRQTKEY